jgi:hypothetical protein
VKSIVRLAGSGDALTPAAPKRKICAEIIRRVDITIPQNFFLYSLIEFRSLFFSQAEVFIYSPSIFLFNYLFIILFGSLFSGPFGAEVA